MDTHVVEPEGDVFVPSGYDPSGYLHEENAATDDAQHAESRDVGIESVDAQAEGTVREYLLAQKGIGEAKATSILDEIDVDGDRSLASLGPRQREHLDRLTAELA